MPLAAADDDLLLRHLPLWWQPLRRLLSLHWPLSLAPWRVRAMALLIQRAQKRAQNKAFRQRQQLNKMDRKAREMMSFVRGD